MIALRRAAAGLAATLLLTATAAAATDSIAEAWQGTYWGESSAALMQHFGDRARHVPQPIDFGDSYADLVLPRVDVGGFPLVVFFQMDKATRGLKRVQLERNRHGVNPPAFRGVLGALDAAYGSPDTRCGIRPGPASGYQQAAEQVWRRDGVVIRAIFRDTTIEAFEGCVFGDPSLGACGLTGQLLVRISPPALDAGACPASDGRPGAAR
jgi:hypothetical protein